ncbi:hypothetical protein AB0J86_13240 [Micromonospora sp. NPDC049559]|uniref:hypothetical protein n=1 Tax=Micromonospora sp. NPDC049559 TaxID=3155923 RepID=UPI0034430260
MRGLTFVARATAATIAAAALLGDPVSASSQSGNTFVEVNPNTAEAGSRVSIRASCGDTNTRQANVQSDAFGRVIVRPDNGFLTGAVTIPGSRSPGTFGVNLNCPNGNTASTTITVVNMSKPSQGPATGAGGTAGTGMGPVVLGAGLAAVAAAVGLGVAARRRRAGMGS